VFRHFKTHTGNYTFSARIARVSLLCSCPSMNRLRLTVYSMLSDSSECQWRIGGDFLEIVAQLCALIFCLLSYFYCL